MSDQFDELARNGEKHAEWADCLRRLAQRIFDDGPTKALGGGGFHPVKRNFFDLYKDVLNHAAFGRKRLSTLDDLGRAFGCADFDALCARLKQDPTFFPSPEYAQNAPKQELRKESKHIVYKPLFPQQYDALWNFVRHPRNPRIPAVEALPAVFASQHRKLREDQKSRSLIIQQSFVTTIRPRAEIESFARLGRAAGRLPPPAHVWAIDRRAHLVSKGYSILQSMSEEFVGFDRIGDYLSRHYLDEMNFGKAAPIAIRFLGVVTNLAKGIPYLFYVFEVAMHEEVKIDLVVDYEDTLVLKKLDADLLGKVSSNRADIVTLIDLLGWRPPARLEYDRGDARAIPRGFPGAVLPDGIPGRHEFDPSALAYADIDAWEARHRPDRTPPTRVPSALARQKTAVRTARSRNGRK